MISEIPSTVLSLIDWSLKFLALAVIIYYRSDKVFSFLRGLKKRISKTSYDIRFQQVCYWSDSKDLNLKSKRSKLNNLMSLEKIQEDKVQATFKEMPIKIRIKQDKSPAKDRDKYILTIGYTEKKYTSISEFFEDVSELKEELDNIIASSNNKKYTFDAKLESGSKFITTHMRNLENRKFERFNVEFNENGANIHLTQDKLSITSRNFGKLKRFSRQYIKY